MTRDTDRAEIEALKRALDTACDEIARQRDNVLAESIRAERAISQRIPTRQPFSLASHVVAFALGALTATFLTYLLATYPTP